MKRKSNWIKMKRLDETAGYWQNYRSLCQRDNLIKPNSLSQERQVQPMLVGRHQMDVQVSVH